MGLSGMALQDGLAEDVTQTEIPDLFCSRVAVDNPALSVDEDDPLFHGVENGFENRKVHLNKK
jgi:hypothetical protein